MTDQPSDPSQRRVSSKEVLGAFVVVVVLVAAFAVAQIAPHWVGVLIFLVLAAVGIWSVARLRREDRQRIGERLEAERKAPLGRVMGFVEVAAILFAVFLALRWLVGKF